MEYVWAFLIGGFICLLGQVLVIKTKLTPTRILVLFLIIGGILEFIGVYDAIVNLAGAGAKVPISGFGAGLVRNVREQVIKDGFLGVFTGGFVGVAGGVTVAIVCSYLVGLIFSSKSKNK